MKIILGSTSDRIGQELIELIASVVMALEGNLSDLEHTFGGDLLDKKIGVPVEIGKAPKQTYRCSLRDRYGGIMDRLLNTSLGIARAVGLPDRD